MNNTDIKQANKTPIKDQWLYLEGEVVSVKWSDFKHIPGTWGRAYRYLGIVVKDAVAGNVWFKTTSQKLIGIDKGDTFAGWVKVTGFGEPSQKYPNPLVFAKSAKQFTIQKKNLPLTGDINP